MTTMASSTAQVLLRLADRLDADDPTQPMREHAFPELIRDAAWSTADALLAALKAPDIAPGETRAQYADRLRTTAGEGR